MLIQILINEIANGFLVAAPDTGGRLMRNQDGSQGVQMKVTYCKDYQAVCEAIKSVWPVNIASK